MALGKNRCRFWSSGVVLNRTKLHIGKTRPALTDCWAVSLPAPRLPNVIRLSDLSPGDGSPASPSERLAIWLALPAAIFALLGKGFWRQQGVGDARSSRREAVQIALGPCSTSGVPLKVEKTALVVSNGFAILSGIRFLMTLAVRFGSMRSSALESDVTRVMRRVYAN